MRRRLINSTINELLEYDDYLTMKILFKDLNEIKNVN